MATKYNLTTAFTAITETSGTIQNVGKEAVELASSTNAVAGEGIVLNPGEKRSFKGALSARSIGDAGADVNVVDFTEAGEGGEEYILPVASDTTLGGIKISNSFTVANDGTLNIKKSGKTILGGVKSSDDDGKVTVNNDGTMTYNPLGYRQPSTIYTAGDIKYHSALPTGWYLECTTAGTTGSGDITPSGNIGGTVVDGTVSWTIRSTESSYRDLSKNMQPSDLNDFVTQGLYSINDTNIVNHPNPGAWGKLLAFDVKRPYDSAELPIQIFMDHRIGGHLFLRQKISDVWQSWQQQEAIVAKSLGGNGYIKYASGLIVQWGKASPAADTTNELVVTLPISYSSASSYIALAILNTGTNNNTRPIGAYVSSSSKIGILSSEKWGGSATSAYWFTIGY